MRERGGVSDQPKSHGQLSVITAGSPSSVTVSTRIMSSSLVTDIRRVITCPQLDDRKPSTTGGFGPDAGV
jgi:hypothetical protein